jgi:hypothetical protein
MHMAARRAAVLVSGAAAAAVLAVVLVSTGASDKSPPAAAPTAQSRPTAARPAGSHPKGVVIDCARRSEADFPGAFTDPHNLAIGPLALMGAAYTPASVVRQFGGNKFPLIVTAGHTVTVRVRGRSAGLAYAGFGKRRLPEGEVRLRDTADTMTFAACRPGRPPRSYQADGPSSSYADGEQVTFWSGFFLTRTPSCVPLEVYVDAQPSPRRVGLSLGRRCGGQQPHLAPGGA